MFLCVSIHIWKEGRCFYSLTVVVNVLFVIAVCFLLLLVNMFCNWFYWSKGFYFNLSILNTKQIYIYMYWYVILPSSVCVCIQCYKLVFFSEKCYNFWWNVFIDKLKFLIKVFDRKILDFGMKYFWWTDYKCTLSGAWWEIKITKFRILHFIGFLI